MGVFYDEYSKMCEACKEKFYLWYYDTVWEDRPELKTTQEIFESQIRENNAKDVYHSARLRYETMLSDYKHKRTDLSKNELESQKRYFEHTKKVWEHSLLQLREKISEQEARDRGYVV